MMRVLELIILPNIYLSLNGFHLCQPVDGIQNASRMKFIAQQRLGLYARIAGKKIIKSKEKQIRKLFVFWQSSLEFCNIKLKILSKLLVDIYLNISLNKIAQNKILEKLVSTNNKLLKGKYIYIYITNRFHHSRASHQVYNLILYYQLCQSCPFQILFFFSIVII